MKLILNFVVLFLFISFSYNFKCEFDNDNIKSEFQNLKVIVNSKFEPYHPLKIEVDFSSIDKDENIPINIKKSIKNIILNKNNFLYQLITIKNNSFIIFSKENPSKLCSKNIPYFNDKLYKKGYNADLLIFPILDIIDDPNSILKSYICSTTKDKNRPTIAYIIFNKNINYDDKYIKEEAKGTYLHNIIHLLGFNIPCIKKNKFYNENKIKISRGKNVIYKLNTFFHIKEIIDKLNFKAKLETINENPSSHWHNIKINDIMLSNDYEYSPLSEFTIAYLKDTNFYTINKCSLFYLNEKCYRFNKCVLFNNITNSLVGYYYDEIKNKSGCYIDDINKKICENNYDILFNNENFNFTPNKIDNIENYIPINQRSELININSQKISLLSPSEKCPNKHPRTVYFYYNESILPNDWEKLKKYKIENITLTDKRYFMTFKTFYNSYNTKSVVGTLNFSNFIRSYKRQDNNIISEFAQAFEREEIYNKLKKYQKFDIFPINKEITIKSNLYINYKNMKDKFPKDFDYLPETYIMPKDKDIIDKKFKNYKLDLNDLWIIKPKSSSRGRGVHLLSDNKINLKKSDLISKYISNPHTLHGKKYDIRLYVLCTGFSPLKIYLFNEGIVRISSEIYKLTLESIKNLYIHLTNTSINKKNRKYKRVHSFESEEGNDWILATYKKHLLKNGINFDSQILPKIKDTIVKTFVSILEKSSEKLKSYHFGVDSLYQLYGLDILIDSNFKPWIMELNYGPQLSNIDEIDLKIKSQVVTDLYNIIGIVPFKKDLNDNKPLDEVTYYKDRVQEAVDNSICELERPRGGYELIFPLKENIDYYSKFVKADEVNLKFWDYIRSN